MRVNKGQTLYESFMQNLNEDKNQDFLDYLSLDNAAMRYAGIEGGDMTFDQYQKYQEYIRNARKNDTSRYEVTISYWDKDGYEKEKTYVGKSVKDVAKKFVAAKEKYDYKELEDWSDNLSELCHGTFSGDIIADYLETVAAGKEPEVVESAEPENPREAENEEYLKKIKDEFGYCIESIEGSPEDRDFWVYLLSGYISDAMECHTIHEHTAKECYEVLQQGITEDKNDHNGYGEASKRLKESETIWSSEYIEDDGSVNDYDEGVWEAQKDDLEYNIVPSIKEQTTDDIVFFCGTVGRWNGNFNGGKVVEVNSADDLLFGDVDTINLLNDNGNLVWEGIHHDGSHEMGLYAMPKDEETRKKLVEELGIVDWYYGMYQYDSREEALQDALNDLYSAKRLNDILEPKDFADIAKICQPIKVKE